MNQYEINNGARSSSGVTDGSNDGDFNARTRWPKQTEAFPSAEEGAGVKSLPGDGNDPSRAENCRVAGRPATGFAEPTTIKNDTNADDPNSGLWSARRSFQDPSLQGSLNSMDISAVGGEAYFEEISKGASRENENQWTEIAVSFDERRRRSHTSHLSDSLCSADGLVSWAARGDDRDDSIKDSEEKCKASAGKGENQHSENPASPATPIHVNLSATQTSEGAPEATFAIGNTKINEVKLQEDDSEFQSVFQDVVHGLSEKHHFDAVDIALETNESHPLDSTTYTTTLADLAEGMSIDAIGNVFPSPISEEVEKRHLQNSSQKSRCGEGESSNEKSFPHWSVVQDDHEVTKARNVYDIRQTQPSTPSQSELDDTSLSAELLSPSHATSQYINDTGVSISYPVSPSVGESAHFSMRKDPGHITNSVSDTDFGEESSRGTERNTDSPVFPFESSMSTCINRPIETEQMKLVPEELAIDYAEPSAGIKRKQNPHGSSTFPSNREGLVPVSESISKTRGYRASNSAAAGPHRRRRKPKEDKLKHVSMGFFSGISVEQDGHGETGSDATTKKPATRHRKNRKPRPDLLKDVSMGYFSGTNVSLEDMGGTEVPLKPRHRRPRKPKPDLLKNISMGYFSGFTSQRSFSDNVPVNPPRKKRVFEEDTSREFSEIIRPLYEWAPVFDERTRVASEYGLPIILPAAAFGLKFSSYGIAYAIFLPIVHTFEVALTNFGPKTEKYRFSFAPISPLWHIVIDSLLSIPLAIAMFIWPIHFGPYSYFLSVYIFLNEYVHWAYAYKDIIIKRKQEKREQLVTNN